MNKEQMEEQEMLRVQREQQERIEKLHILNRYAEKGQILFVGSSLMEQFPVNEILMTKGLFYKIYNRGVSGFTTADMLNHMDTMVFDLEPSRIFINIGTNDIGAPGYSEDALLSNYRRILAQIKERLSEAEVYVMANRNNRNIDAANRRIAGLAAEMGMHYIDVSEGLRDAQGKLKAEFTVEGIHMYANAYYVIFENMERYL